MSGRNIPRFFFCAILAAAAFECIRDFPLLPQRIASHFAASGVANGWMTKSQFLIVYAVLLLPAFFVEFGLHRKIADTPEKSLNLPNKQYWLAPERRAETFAYIELFCAWYGCVLLLLEVCAMGLAMRANFLSPPHMPTAPIISLLLGFSVFTVAGIVAMRRRFSRIG
jgi:uncharacterized membrane protein